MIRAHVQESVRVVAVPGRYVPAPPGSGRLIEEAKARRTTRMVVVDGRVVHVEGMDEPL